MRQWYWQLGSRDQTHGSDVVRPAAPLREFWFGVPLEVDRVDAVVERPSDGRIFVFSGLYKIRLLQPAPDGTVLILLGSLCLQFSGNRLFIMLLSITV